MSSNIRWRSWLRPIGSLALTVLLGACAHAPVPTLADQRNASQIADAEQRFAAAVAELGVRDGFLQFVAADAVLIREEPVPAVPTLRDEPPERIWLDWYPERIVTSAIGDLALSTGPYETRADPAGKRSALGRFFTLWRRDELNTWKVAFDAGVGSGRRDCAPCLPPRAARTRLAWALPSADASSSSARDAELRFELAQSGGDLPALRRLLHPELMALREGPGALASEDAAQAVLALARWKTVDRSAMQVSASDDLAYAFGRMRSTADGHANWARVWIRTASSWQLLLDWTDLPAPK